MNYTKGELLVPIFVAIVGMIYLWRRSRNQQVEFIHMTWFKGVSKLGKLRFFLKMLGFSLLLISLLDFRGPEEKIESNIPDQKTIIIIDSSASMLAEDVRPNRYEKSILMARHFIKKAFGHRIAVVLFSDTQKRLVPFTDDLDLLDARVAGLNELKNYDGGSNISQAIKESIGYFRVENGTDLDVGGNVLVFTDSEGHDEASDFTLPGKVSLAIVGVGTLKGARIPNRDRYNTFRGYKKFEGKEVYTKLNENWLKSLANKVSTYKYWIANSYTIPTEEILKFFNTNFDKKISKGSATIRPVKAHYILLPALVLLIISFALYPLQTFSTLLIILSLTLISTPSFAQEEEKEIVLNKETTTHLKGLVEGKLDQSQKVRLAELLVRDGDFSRANMLYAELGRELSQKARNNYAVSLIQEKRPEEALRILGEIQLQSRRDKAVDQGFMKDVRQNVLLALKEQKKQKEEQKKKQDQKKNDKSKGDGKGSDEQKQNSKDQKNKKGDKEQDNKKKKENKDQKSDKENEKDNENKGKPKKKKKKTLAEKQREIEKKKKMIKVPGLIKQILSDDRNLQKRHLDTSTKKPKARRKKDW